jgi:hypothetical protein
MLYLVVARTTATTVPPTPTKTIVVELGLEMLAMFLYTFFLYLFKSRIVYRAVILRH